MSCMRAHPLKLELYRPKTGVEYYTFLGRDAVQALKAYLSDMRSRGTEFQYDTPLFLKERGKDAITTNLVQNMMRAAAVKSGLVDKRNNGKAFNPLGPHALRESFGSIMINSGVPDTIVDFWLGHSIGEMAEAYKSVQGESLKRMYLERERLLSVTAEAFDERELEAKVTAKVDERVQALQVITNYATQNQILQNRINIVEQKIGDWDKTIHEIKRHLGDLEKIMRQTKEAD